MAGTNDRCPLYPYNTSGHCKMTCGSCGWNPKVANARSAEIDAKGLTLCPDGLHRYIVKDGGETNGNT